MIAYIYGMVLQNIINMLIKINFENKRKGKNMNFEELYIEIINNEGKCINKHNYEITNFKDKDCVIIPYFPLSQKINAEIEAIDYEVKIRKNNDDELYKIKNNLLELLKKYNNLKDEDKDNRDSKDFITLIELHNVIIDNLWDLNTTADEYYLTINQVKYIKDFCDKNEIKYDINEYKIFLDSLRYSYCGLFKWENGDINDIRLKYESIIGFKFPQNSNYSFIEYKDNIELIKQESIKFDSSILFLASKTDNWILFDDINKIIREKILRYQLARKDYYLVYNITEKKYNYYDNSKKNKIMFIRCQDNSRFKYYGLDIQVFLF